MKTLRAAEHLKKLQADCKRFRKDPYTITKEDQPERGRQIVRVELKRATTDIPIGIGEFAYQLRSALDQLAWQLGLLSGKRPPNNSAFPIHTDEGPRSIEQFRCATARIPIEAVEIIRSLQPYKRGNDFKAHPLWQLNKLCNLDKHATVAFSHTNVIVGSSGPPIDLLWRDVDQAVEFAVPMAFKDQVQFEPKEPDLVFGRPIEAPGAEFFLSESDIAEIHRFVGEDVLPKFVRFFPPSINR